MAPARISFTPLRSAWRKLGEKKVGKIDSKLEQLTKEGQVGLSVAKIPYSQGIKLVFIMRTEAAFGFLGNQTVGGQAILVIRI